MAINTKLKNKYILVILFLFMMGCVETFQPPYNQSALDLLVVEGFINATEKNASVKLSHTQSISDIGKPLAEGGAEVFITVSNGQIYSLTEQTLGQYKAEDLLIDRNASYTLNIKTKSGNVYQSENIFMTETPPIDNLYTGFSNDKKGITILIDTHDQPTKNRHYVWNFIETYEFHAAYNSAYLIINKLPVMRKPEQLVYTCWRTEPSTSILIGSTVRLSENRVHGYTLVIIPGGSLKTSIRYSILVKQRSITSAEYDYLDQLEKTTEKSGGLFATMPGSVIGNIHQVNNTLPVLGYFSGSEIKEKRFFLDYHDLPIELQIPPSYDECQLESTCPKDYPPNQLRTCVDVENISASSIIVSAVSDGTGVPVSYTFAVSQCADCTVMGGSTTKPDFWP